jgi:hypothetical protein
LVLPVSKHKTPNSFTLRRPFGFLFEMPGIAKIPGMDYIIMVEIPSGITVILPGYPKSASAIDSASAISFAGYIFIALTISGSASEISTTRKRDKILARI